MSMIQARKRRTNLYLSAAGLLVMVAAMGAISSQEPNGVAMRTAMILITAGAGLWLSWRQLVPAFLLAWLLPNIARALVDDQALSSVYMLLELPGLAGIAFFTWMARESLRKLEREFLLMGSGDDELAGRDPGTGLFDSGQLRPALASELARSRRFGHTFSLVLVGIDERRQKFDYRSDAAWQSSLRATMELLRQTRFNVDRVFHYKADSFAIILPESTEEDIPGLVKRLRRLARSMKPAEGEPGGPMPVHFGATFFPECATTVDDLLRRADVALHIASKSTTRYQLDSAEAPDLPPAESLRRDYIESDVAGISRAPETQSVSRAPTVATAESWKVVPAEAVAIPAEASPATPETAEPSKLLAPARALPCDDRPGTSVEPGQMLAPGAASPAQLASDVDEEFRVLLKQMDETLEMIRSVRNQAA